ncbi:MAG TPA: CPBP family glutamic-type intramembrane protease [Abditibacterium sp.]|jgi:hypothetical protein
MTAPRFHPFVCLLLCALGMLALQTAVGILLVVGSVFATVYTGRPSAEPLDQLAKRYELALTVLLYPAMLLWIALCRVQFDCRSFVSLGLRQRRAFPDAARGAVAGALSIGLLWSILWLTGAISVEGQSPEAFEGGVGRSILALLGYAAVFVSVGFFEETLFRGYVLHNFTRWFGWKSAIVAQAMLFAVVHLANVAGQPREAWLAALGALPSLFLIAVFFALCARKTGSLWFPIGFHFAWNFFLGPVLSLPVSGIKTFRLLDVSANESSWLSGGAFGAEGSWLLIPIIAALIFFIAQAPDHPQTLRDVEPLPEPEPLPLPVAAPELVEAEEEAEEERESRFRTKFGSAQGFSADTLRELRELQDARERAQREAEESARREQISVARVAPEPVASVAVAPVAPVFAPQVATVAAKPVVEEAKPTEAKIVEVKTAEVEPKRVPSEAEAPVTPAPVEPAVVEPVARPALKKPAPRW